MPGIFGMTQSIQNFVDYVFSFYAPGQEYGHFFENKLTLEEVKAAVLLLVAAKGDAFCGDSFDREETREILLFVRDRKELAKRAIG